MLAKAVKKGILKNWKVLRMIPIPFGEALSDFFKGNRLGGWHFGGTLPMVDAPSLPKECNSEGMVSGLKGVYVVDSAAFPSLPSSTVALLIAAHGHRVARDWVQEKGQTKGKLNHAD
jgi:choline dehydrogenase-like flavoprotein